jgi:hypothetical protein
MHQAVPRESPDFVFKKSYTILKKRKILLKKKKNRLQAMA